MAPAGELCRDKEEVPSGQGEKWGRLERTRVQVDKSPTSLAELKLPALKKEDEKDEVRAFVRDISDPEKLKEYQKNVN